MILAVLGAGTMGRGIAQLALQSGFSVRLFDALPEALSKGREAIIAGVSRGVSLGKISKDDGSAALDRFHVARGLSDLAPAEFAIEAVFEDLEVKKSSFAALESVLGEGAVLATNTSSIPVSLVAASCRIPSRVVGMHFFNPPVSMKLVEIIRHEGAAAFAVEAAQDAARRMGRTPVLVADSPGFLVNRVVRSYYLVAQRLAAAGAGSFAAIDAAARAVGGMPMGPFSLMDFIGLEVNLAITRSIYEGLGRPERLKPHSLQESLVAAGCRGRKSGLGFYVYEDGREPRENPEALALLPGEKRLIPADEIFKRMMDAVRAEAEIVVAEGIASETDVDAAVRLAMNFPKGPFERG